MDYSVDSHLPVKLLIVVDVRLYRDGLEAALSARRAVSVVGTAAARGEALASARALVPDVVLVDVAVSGALALMGDIPKEVPNARVLAFAVDEDVSTVVACAQAGAVGYVDANASIDELVRAVRLAAGGELLCSPRIAAELLRRIGTRGPVPNKPQPPLTAREQQVCACLAQGLSNREIALSLNISAATAKNHVHNVLTKLHVPTRAKVAPMLTPPGLPLQFRSRAASCHRA